VWRGAAPSREGGEHIGRHERPVPPHLGRRNAACSSPALEGTRRDLPSEMHGHCRGVDWPRRRKSRARWRRSGRSISIHRRSFGVGWQGLATVHERMPGRVEDDVRIRPGLVAEDGSRRRRWRFRRPRELVGRPSRGAVQGRDDSQGLRAANPPVARGRLTGGQDTVLAHPPHQISRIPGPRRHPGRGDAPPS
jgi:hypothetical protein